MHGALGSIWGSFTDYLPDLITALIIIFISHLMIKLLKQGFDLSGNAVSVLQVNDVGFFRFNNFTDEAHHQEQ